VLSRGAIDVLARHAPRNPVRLGQCTSPSEGAVTPVGEGETAFCCRHVAFVVDVTGRQPEERLVAASGRRRMAR
jgi:hypothetical protein